MAGVSPDAPEVTSRYREELGLRSVLLSDPDRTIRRAYKSMRVFGGFRTTYLIDKVGVIRGANEYLVVGMGGHVKKLLKGLEAIRRGEAKG